MFLFSFISKFLNLKYYSLAIRTCLYDWNQHKAYYISAPLICTIINPLMNNLSIKYLEAAHNEGVEEDVKKLHLAEWILI